MSDRLRDAFSFHGRLSRAGQRRLSLKLLPFGLIVFIGPIFMTMWGWPRSVALAPLVGIPLLAVSHLASTFRRLHDVGLHARQVAARSLLMGMLSLVLIFLCVVGGATAPGLTDLLRLSVMAGGPTVILAILVVRGWNRPEWRAGDLDPNAFGPPTD